MSHGDNKYNIYGKDEGKSIKERAGVDKKSVEKDPGEPFCARDYAGSTKSGEVPGDFCLWQGRMQEVMGYEQSNEIDHKQEKTGGNKKKGE
jgi:hypothetical protein